MKTRKLLPIAAAVGLAAVVGFQSGCLAVAVGAAAAGTVAYVKGSLDATLEAPYDRVVSATDKALDDLKLARVGVTKDEMSSVFNARNADDDKVEVKVSKKTEDYTKVSIRIGVFGDEAKSRMVLDKIKEHL